MFTWKLEQNFSLFSSFWGNGLTLLRCRNNNVLVYQVRTYPIHFQNMRA